MGTPPAILILDTSVLVNFLAVDRADLLASLSSPVLVTQHIVAEVSLDYPEQHARLKIALEASHLREIEITDLGELALFAQLSSRNASRRKRLGEGECSAIAVAVLRGYALGIEDRQAIKQVRELYPDVPIRRTHELVLELIQASALSVPQADAIKHALSTQHRFEMREFTSFADILPPRTSPP